MLVVLSGPTFATQRQHLADLAIHYRLPTMFAFPYYVEAGGLMSYGIDTVPIFHLAAAFVAKLLRGAQPADLPVEQPTSFEFSLNLKTAKAIGVSIPTSILLRADQVIEIARACAPPRFAIVMAGLVPGLFAIGRRLFT